MGLAEIAELIKALLTFPQSILEFVRLFKKTPQEKRDALLVRMREEADHFAETGRPTW